MRTSFSFTADTINGAIQERPKIFTLDCECVIPIGVDIVRDFDESLCIVAKRVFLIRYNQDVFGTCQFKSLEEFIQYKNLACSCCQDTVECVLLINGCNATINGCNLLYQ